MTEAADTPKPIDPTLLPDNPQMARIDVPIRATTDQLSNLGVFQNRSESVVHGADYAAEGPASNN
ncbi:hypothetical protein ACIF6H_35530 [Streptomyces microflavus]|uniref:hypothetical protein n=1 Tax=Streptomyces microflavus TaxID=1919 RepID=UPI0037D1366A